MAKILSIHSSSIKYKLIIASSLMSVIPILICLNYIFPSFLDTFIAKINLPLVVFIMVFIAILGFIVIKQIVDPVAKMSRDAKLIAEGDIERRIQVRGEDEIGQLGLALNKLTSRIKENMDELKDYGLRTTEVNLEIQKRIIVLSGLLQISELISQGARLDDILNLCLDKIKDLSGSSVAAVFLLFLEDGKFCIRIQNGLNIEALPRICFSEHSESAIQIFKNNASTIIDAQNSNDRCQEFLSILGFKNLLCLPIFARKKPTAILAVSNSIDNFVFKHEDQELLDIFAKQITIAIENAFLVNRIEKLEIRDALTGLYNEHYIRNRLDEEIKRAIAYQRPCGFVLARINDFASYQKTFGLISAEAGLKKISSCLNTSISGIDRLGRIGDYEFAIVLPDKNKRQAQRIAGELQKKVEYLFKEESEEKKRLDIEVAVAENPIDGVSSQELIACARKSIETANIKNK